MKIFSQLEKSHYSIFINLLAKAVFFGATFTIIGAVLPQIIRSFGWNYSEAGLVIMGGSIGYFSSTFASGFLLRIIRPRLLSGGGLILITVGLVCFGMSPSVYLNLTLSVIIGLAHGIIEVIINFCTIQIEKQGRSQLMNLLHAAFSVGAVIGPLLPAQLMNNDMPWQISYRILSLISILLIFWITLLPFHRIVPKQTAIKKTRPLPRSNISIIIICSTILLLYVGAEVGLTSWISEYFVKVLNTSTSNSALFVSLFWVGVLSGRLIIAFTYKGTRPAIAIAGLACISTAGLIIALSTNTIIFSLLGFIITGFGFSSIYPLVMSLIGSSFVTEHQSLAIGYASTGGGIGAFVFPFIMANFSQQKGIEQGFMIFIGITITITIIATIAVIRVRTPSKN